MVKNSFRQFRALLMKRHFSLFVVLFVSALLLTGCSTKPIVTVPEEAEAIQIVDVLREYELSADKVETIVNNKPAYQIFVHGDTFGGETATAAAYQVLRAHCLPQTEPPDVPSATLSSPDIERAQIQRQQKMNIIAQLRNLPAATCVDVNYVLPQDPLITTQPYPARASVTLNHKAQELPYTEAEVRSIVSGTIPNLSADNVTVKFIYQPIAAPPKSKSSSLRLFLLIGGVGLVIILGSVLTVYFLRRSQRSKTEALAEREEILETAETVES